MSTPTKVRFGRDPAAPSSQRRKAQPYRVLFSKTGTRFACRRAQTEGLQLINCCREGRFPFGRLVEVLISKRSLMPLQQVRAASS
jgi:hypothetical protein